MKVEFKLTCSKHLGYLFHIWKVNLYLTENNDSVTMIFCSQAGLVECQLLVILVPFKIILKSNVCRICLRHW